MRTFIKYLMITALFWGICFPASAHINPKLQGKNAGNSNAATVRSDCSPGEALIEQSINNVRATLLTSGDVWWNGNGDAAYIVPKVDPASGLPAVSSVFAGAVWLGGFDGTSLKVACQQYGSSNGNVDFWPGPLTEQGITSADTCSDWDRHFRVTGAEIDLHLSKFQSGNTYNEADIPDGVKYYPGKGNEYFVDRYGFELPAGIQGLGAFHDANSNEIYDPLGGDFPKIDIRGCPDDNPIYPDELISWFYNDAGNTHGETGAEAIRMEIQVQAFGFITNDELNNMTFQRYKLINRAVSNLDSCYFAMWVDPDLGCYTDDYVGCDTSRSLMYIYNADELDGQTGCSCPGGVETYCDEIPMLGVDYFRGPTAPKSFGPNGTLVDPPIGFDGDTLVELGMSSFTYYNNGGDQPAPPAGTDDPDFDFEYYNLLTGRWKDGTPFTVGGDGYNPGSTDVIKYAFPDPPNVTGGFSMSQEGLAERDRRTVQASGPFRLEPGAVNELIIGVPWVPSVTHPSPTIDKLTIADDLAQALFDNCFDKNDGPFAPNVDWIELDRTIVALLSNDTIEALTNNAFEQYEEKDLRLPDEVADLGLDSTYNFEGYLLYQIASPSSAAETDIYDTDHYRLVAQVDLKNEAGDLYEWITEKDPRNPDDSYSYAVQKISEASNSGIRHVFKIEKDLFTNARLINHKKYYYRAIAYGYNEFLPFDPATGTGQSRPFIGSAKNLGQNDDPNYYTVIPRKITDKILNSEVGDELQITRLDGVGAGENSLRITEETRDEIMDGTSDGSIVYERGAGPISVAVYNPLEVVEADFELQIVDEDLSNFTLDEIVSWIFIARDVTTGEELSRIESDTTIVALNEQLIKNYGVAVTIVQSDEPGDLADKDNGAIEVVKVYEDEIGPEWLSGIPDGGVGSSQDEDNNLGRFYNYIKTGPNEANFDDDPESRFSTMGDGTWVPYTLCDWKTSEALLPPYLTPGWFDVSGGTVVSGNFIYDLPNIDVVFTSNKDLWSKCIVVETASSIFEDFWPAGYAPEGEAEQFDTRKAVSVGKDGKEVSDDTDTGFGWFPGYAIDVETGNRVNVFFGENSIFSCKNDTAYCAANGFTPDQMVGGDMIFNPTSDRFIESGFILNNQFLNFYDGGQHMVYVTDVPYDGCRSLDSLINHPSSVNKIRALRKVRWASYSLLAEGASLLSVEDGLVPNDLTVHLRVDNSYKAQEGVGTNNGHPTYTFSTQGLAPRDIETDEEIASALDAISVVPNPYYGFSDYEVDEFSNIIKITNLPAKAVVTIYSLEGKFIRQYNRDEQGMSTEGESNPGVRTRQFLPDLEWDLKNNAGIPVASGVYLIHVNAEGLGERTLKWFGIARQFDPSGL